LINELYRPAWTEVLSIFFADMRGFTRLCQVLNSPEAVQRMLNQFMTMLVTQVIQHKGTVNKFLGDGLLALFRGEGHAHEAALCAFGAADEFAALHRTWNSEVNAQLDFLDIGFGIATDQVIIGTIGAARARDFTVMGTAVNLAAALQNRARGGKRILVDQMTYSAVKDLVGEIEGPEMFELRKPDQPTGHSFKQYHLKTLASPNRIFVSHSHLDRAFVEAQLVGPLKACHIDTWYSRESIGPGEVWVRSIPEGLAKCNWVVVVVSKNAAESDWVKEEIELAKSQTGGFRGRIIPVVLDDTPPEMISPWLRQIQAINAQEEEHLANRIHEIIKTAGNR
jgi:class 3 adenylate cyclase